MLNFNEYIPEAKALQLGDNSTPILRMIFGLDYSLNPLDMQSKWLDKMKIPLHIFPTIVGDFCMDIGLIPTFIMILFFSVVFSNLVPKKREKLRLHDVFFIYVLSAILCQGVFYFTYKTIGGNLKIIVFCSVYIFLSYLCKQKMIDKIIIEKK
jgi:hypothetical protein